MKPRCHCLLTVLAAICLAFLSQSLPVATVKAGEMSYQERLEMKKRVQRQIDRGEVPQVKPGMPFEERLYIKKKQQDLEKERAQRGGPPPEMQRPRPEPSDRYRPDYGDRHYDDRPSRYDRENYEWRERRCWELWEGRERQYNRCLDGDRDYLYPRSW